MAIALYARKSIEKENSKGTKGTIYAESLEDMVYTEIANKLETLKNIRISERKNVHPEINEHSK